MANETQTFKQLKSKTLPFAFIETILPRWAIVPFIIVCIAALLAITIFGGQMLAYFFG
ncbi:MAG: hypothetical protein JWM20_626 [Patescibacteria group bacterium]|nr:hypothetical protein [Patescibacteria group bacterium]